MEPLTIHLIGNAHLDPVWLWDWREGLNQGLVTCRTILDLMDADPDITFNRGEAAIYLHIEKTDPATFARIKKYVKAGRWDPIGGTYIQPDDNLPATETFARQYTRGLRYFASRFNKQVKAAWSADCFGHSAGMPEVLAAAGMKFFAFTRPDAKTMPLPKPAFWWIGASGSRILAYRPSPGWYGTDRDEITKRLDQTVSGDGATGLQTLACFYGMGDHGGGPTKRQADDIRAWAAAHPEVRVVHSTLHRFFGELEREIAGKPRKFLPEHVGELNFTLRGTYASMAKFKFPYRKAEAAITAAERTDAIIAAELDRKPADLAKAWDNMLFNAFHDILPGTSIERAFDEQIAQLGHVQHEADAAQFAALGALTVAVDTTVLPAPEFDKPTGIAAIVWNPHPRPIDTFIEFEACLDDRMIFKYKNELADDVPVRVLDHRKKPLPFQLMATEHHFCLIVPWRKRAIVPIKLPAMGWSVIEMAWLEGAPAPQPPKESKTAATAKGEEIGKPSTAASLSNGIFSIEATVGEEGVKILRNGKPFVGGAGLGAEVRSDPSGPWGDEKEDKESAEARPLLERWKVTDIILLERGPWRSAMWVRLAGAKSRIEFTFHLYAGRDAVDVDARVMWDNPQARLNLTLPVENEGAEFDVNGARVTRTAAGDLPGGRWVRVIGKKAGQPSLGFASDALYSFNLTREQLYATVLRSTRYAESHVPPDKIKPWMPPTEVGELKFRFLLAPADDRLPNLAAELEQPPTVLLAAASKGTLPTQGSLMTLKPDGVRLLAFKKAEDGKGWIVRLAETAGRAVSPKLTLLGKAVALPKIKAGQIATFRLVPGGKGFKVEPCSVAEL